jgi:hypothetical protein
MGLGSYQIMTESLARVEVGQCSSDAITAVQ